MSEHKSDAEIIKHTHNTARFFTETRHVSCSVRVEEASASGTRSTAFTRCDSPRQ